MKPKLIITADDFGASKIIDRGIIKAIEEELITSVACFANVNHAGFKRIEKLNNDYGHKIDIGLHFNISSGPPLTKLPAKHTRSKSGKRLFKRLLHLNLNETELKSIKIELEAQVNRFEQAKIPIKHFSDHYGMISMFDKALFQCMLDVVKNYNTKHKVSTPVRLPMLWSMDTHDQVLSKSRMKTNGRLGNFIRKWILDVDDESFYHLFKPQLLKKVRQLQSSGLEFVDYSIDQFFQSTTKDTVAFLKAMHRFVEKPKRKASIPSTLSDYTVFEMMAHISDKPKASEETELRELKRFWKINKTSMRIKKPAELAQLKKLFVPVTRDAKKIDLVKFSEL